MIYINLLIIAFLCVFIVDYSGFIQEMEGIFTRVLKSPIPLHIPKPFSCSLCLTWWSSIIYLIIVHQFNFINILVVGGICCLTPEILSIIYFIKDIINKFFDVVERFLHITE